MKRRNRMNLSHGRDYSKYKTRLCEIQAKLSKSINFLCKNDELDLTFYESPKTLESKDQYIIKEITGDFVDMSNDSFLSIPQKIVNIIDSFISYYGMSQNELVVQVKIWYDSEDKAFRVYYISNDFDEYKYPESESFSIVDVFRFPLNEDAVIYGKAKKLEVLTVQIFYGEGI